MKHTSEHDTPRFADVTYQPFRFPAVYEPERYRCAICKGDTLPLADTCAGWLCSACRVICPGCERWLANEPAIEHKGKQWHVDCALEDAEPVSVTIGPLDLLMLAKIGGAE